MVEKSQSIGPHQGLEILAMGPDLDQADGVMILVHGRGASAEGILDLGRHLPHPGLAYLAPRAANNTWYPYSFLVAMSQNEPHLSSALQMLADLTAQVESAGIPSEKIIIGGFSQGACLASEFMARHARRYGGLLLFSGGLIGPPGTPRRYGGSLDGTPVFLGCSDLDPHIPIERVEETAAVLSQLGAQVNKKIYPRMGHTIVQDEIDQAQKIVDLI